MRLIRRARLAPGGVKRDAAAAFGELYAEFTAAVDSMLSSIRSRKQETSSPTLLFAAI